MNQAKKLLDAIDSMGGLAGFKRSGDERNAWNAAFNLYNQNNKKRMSRTSCESCREKVYNYLKKNA